MGWSQLVRDPFIALAREGVFGMHPTLLPRHRGRAPIPWAILSGLARTGVTLFEIVDATADSGAIVGQVGRRHRSRRDGDDALRLSRGRACRADPRVRATDSRRHGAADPAGSESCEQLAQARPDRRDHRLGDARPVPVRLGACTDTPVSRRVHVARGGQGDRVARATGRARRAGSRGHDRRDQRRRARRRLRRGWCSCSRRSRRTAPSSAWE